MSDESIKANAIDDAPIARPDVAEPPAKKVDSLGRPMDKPRGRKPLPRNEAGQIIHPDGTLGAAKKTTPGAKAVKAVAAMAELSDENVGKAFSGVFALASLPLGNHWRLFGEEEKELGEVYGPLFRMLGPEEAAKVMKVFAFLAVAPATVTVIMPRLVVQKMIIDGAVDKKLSRPTLLEIKSFMAAEKELNIEAQVQESAAILRGTVRNAAEIAAKAKAAEVASTVGGTNGVISS